LELTLRLQEFSQPYWSLSLNTLCSTHCRLVQTPERSVCPALASPAEAIQQGIDFEQALSDPEMVDIERQTSPQVGSRLGVLVPRVQGLCRRLFLGFLGFNWVHGFHGFLGFNWVHGFHGFLGFHTVLYVLNARDIRAKGECYLFCCTRQLWSMTLTLQVK
jgi:hypothetical protein